jgi:hypothetical protein
LARTLSRLACASAPARLKTIEFGNVTSLKRTTQARARPAALRSVIPISLGQVVWLAVVTMAQITRPFIWLNSWRDITSDGRRCRDVNEWERYDDVVAEVTDHGTPRCRQANPIRTRCRSARQDKNPPSALRGSRRLPCACLKLLPDLFHIADRLDRLLSTSILADTRFLSAADDAINLQLNNLAGAQ